MGQRVRGLHRVGVYVPGGTAAYPSSVLMNVIPAKIAEVGEIVMVTPPGRTGKPDKNILAAAKIAGVDRVFLIGGAQAVAALAYGTESVPKVDKVVGPGNIFVATAKKLLYGTIDIDMIAGPSEILVIADSSARPEYLAADLMSQAEHDRMASAILITPDEALAQATAAEIERQMETLSRREIIRESIDNFGAIIVCESLAEAVDFANELAPEHLEVCCENPLEYIGKLDNAGSVFLGSYSPEPLGDYFAGPNHVLPTSGTARFFSPPEKPSLTERDANFGSMRSFFIAAPSSLVQVRMAGALPSTSVLAVRRKLVIDTPGTSTGYCMARKSPSLARRSGVCLRMSTPSSSASPESTSYLGWPASV